MKKLFCLVLLTFVSISCSTTDEEVSPVNTIDPTKLAKVVFFPETLIERHWIFNENGFLKEITLKDGTIEMNFTYDSKERLINSTLFKDNVSNETHTFNYDNNDFVTSVDGDMVNFDPTTNSYFTGNLNQYYRITQINSEKLLVYGKTAFKDSDIDIDNGNPFEAIMDYISVGYSNNNNLKYKSQNEGCNSFTYDNNKNPLRNSTLAICRAFSYIENSRWVYGLYNSTNNPISEKYCLEDPESMVYQYTYNENNLPLKQTRDEYYGGRYEYSLISALYYYQGDVIPN